MHNDAVTKSVKYDLLTYDECNGSYRPLRAVIWCYSWGDNLILRGVKLIISKFKFKYLSCA